MPHPHILLCPGAIQTHKFKLKKKKLFFSPKPDTHLLFLDKI